MTSESLRHALRIVLVLGLTLGSLAGIISEKHHEHHEHHEPIEHHEHHELKEHHEEHHQHHHASSYMHFHGPVEGPEFEVKIPYFEPHHHEHHEHHEHNHLHHEEHHHEPKYVMDYVAHPKYKYSYGVEDWHTGDFHSQKEERDGSSVSGEYSLSEPGGGFRTVTYHADKDGFHAHVHTTKNDHSGGTYGYKHHVIETHHPEHHEHHHHQAEASQALEHHAHFDGHQQLHEYPVSFGHGDGGF